MCHLLAMRIAPWVTSYDLFVEKMCDPHSLVGSVCLPGHPQPALILFQLLQFLLKIEKRVVIFGLLRAILHLSGQGSAGL